MARLLIVYGTMNGQTAKIAGRMAELTRGQGHAVDLVDAGAAPPGQSPASYDAVIVGGWVRGGKHPRAIRDFVVAHRADLAGRPATFFSVSLFAASRRAEDRERAEAATRAFLDETGWQPTRAATLAGALRYTRWGWLGRRVMRLIWTVVAARSGWSPATLPTDLARDYEYTDWAAVERLVADLLADLAPAPAAALRR
jgi:menaquinone-dependent protoporphyrinogen oxidase